LKGLNKLNFVDYPYLGQPSTNREDPVKEAIMTELKAVLALAQKNHQDTQMILRELQSRYNSE
jgi:hypothetical protein